MYWSTDPLFPTREAVDFIKFTEDFRIQADIYGGQWEEHHHQAVRQLHENNGLDSDSGEAAETLGLVIACITPANAPEKCARHISNFGVQLTTLKL